MDFRETEKSRPVVFALTEIGKSAPASPSTLVSFLTPLRRSDGKNAGAFILEKENDVFVLKRDQNEPGRKTDFTSKSGLIGPSGGSGEKEEFKK